MKSEIHPEYVSAAITCACGATYETRSTRGDYVVDVCSACHPFYTGRQKLMDTAGRVERFRRKYAKMAPKKAATKAAAETPADETASK